MGSFWKNAFAIDRESQNTFTAEEIDLCDRIARKIVSHGLAVPSLLFIEGARPLHFIGSQALAFFEPIVRGLFSWGEYTRFRVLLERRGSIELLLKAIERAEAERAKEIAAARTEERPGLIMRTIRRLKKGGAD